MKGALCPFMTLSLFKNIHKQLLYLSCLVILLSLSVIFLIIKKYY